MATIKDQAAKDSHVPPIENQGAVETTDAIASLPLRSETPEERSDRKRGEARARRDALYISDWNEDGWGFGG